MMRAGKFALPEAGEVILVRPGAEPLRVSSYSIDVGRHRASNDESQLRGMLRELVAIKKK